MWKYFVLRAQNYFVLVLNSLKPFCLSSEQGLNIIFQNILILECLVQARIVQWKWKY